MSTPLLPRRPRPRRCARRCAPRPAHGAWRPGHLLSTHPGLTPSRVWQVRTSLSASRASAIVSNRPTTIERGAVHSTAQHSTAWHGIPPLCDARLAARVAAARRRRERQRLEEAALVARWRPLFRRRLRRFRRRVAFSCTHFSTPPPTPTHPPHHPPHPPHPPPSTPHTHRHSTPLSWRATGLPSQAHTASPRGP